MIWRVGPQQLLAKDGESFVLIDPNGTISARFEPEAGGFDEGMRRVEFVVVGDKLLERVSFDRFGVITETRGSVELTGLQPADWAAARAFVDLVLAEDHLASEQAAVCKKQEDEARVSSIDGALDDFGLGEDFARAQAALVNTARCSQLPPQLALLRTLVSVARAHPPAPVLSAFTRACLTACFEDNLPAPVNGEPAKLPALAAELRAREQDLRRAAEVAIDNDSNMAADSYTRAANEMREAARLAG